MINKNQTVCFTGHRSVKKDNLTLVSSEIEKAIHKGYNTFLSGGAVGFDQYSALKVIELKSKYPTIKLILVLPCDIKTMSKKWNEEEIKEFNYICKKADDIIFVSQQYHNNCMKERNKRLVELSSYCIAYYTKFRSGTGQTIRFMEKSGGIIINIAPKK